MKFTPVASARALRQISEHVPRCQGSHLGECCSTLERFTIEQLGRTPLHDRFPSRRVNRPTRFLASYNCVHGVLVFSSSCEIRRQKENQQAVFWEKLKLCEPRGRTDSLSKELAEPSWGLKMMSCALLTVKSEISRDANPFDYYSHQFHNN